MKKDLGVIPAIHPMPVLMIGTYNEDGSVDVMNAAWGQVCDTDKVILSLGKKRRTVENLKRNKAFTVALADVVHMREADFFGIVSGSRDPLKFARSGLHETKSSRVNAPVIEEFPVVLECELFEIIDTESIYGVVGKVLNVQAEEYALDDAGRVDAEDADLMLFDPFTNQYYCTGSPVGKAWHAGKKLKGLAPGSHFYRRITASCRSGASVLNRTILVREEMSVLGVCAAILTAFRAAFYHLCCITSDDTLYLPGILVDDEDEDACPMELYGLDDLAHRFTLVYDFGEEWTFDCKLSRKEVTVVSDAQVVFESGSGQGIWEDDIAGFRAYVNGELDPEGGSVELDDNVYSLPWNLEMEKFGDFARPLDPDTENAYLSEEFANNMIALSGIEDTEEDDAEDGRPDNLVSLFPDDDEELPFN